METEMTTSGGGPISGAIDEYMGFDTGSSSLSGLPRFNGNDWQLYETDMTDFLFLKGLGDALTWSEEESKFKKDMNRRALAYIRMSTNASI